MLPQQTLRDRVEFSGVGLHSGVRVNMAFLPAPPNSGVRFRRIDLENRPEIEARIEQVADTTRSTTLVKGNAKVQTVEHVLAAFAGCGVDNAIVELDANEPPIVDGSAREYCRMIDRARVVAQGDPRETFTIAEPFEVQAGEASFMVFPHDRLKISCTSADRDGRHTQFLSVELTSEVWRKEIAEARTFCFFEEIEFLIRNGLIKGGSLANAVVIRDDAVLTTEPLRYPDEFVRHKILDILGDLYLLGRPLQAHVVALCPSHAANCELAREILHRDRQRLAAARAFSPPPSPPSGQKRPRAPSETPATALADGATLDIEQVMATLPHRYPFLMLDRVTAVEGNKIRALKNVTINEPFFEGHFPGHPIMPGVLQLEAIAQAAGILMMKKAENAGKLAYFMAAESVKWRKPVRPGDVLEIEVELTKSRGKIGKAKGVCSVKGDPVSEAQVTFMLFDAWG